MKHTLSTSQDRTPAKVWLGAFAIGAVLLVLPFLLGATAGQGWIRILNFALLYVMLALGLNIVVGFCRAAGFGLHRLLCRGGLCLGAAGFAAF